jgi:hypothetical protein
VIGEAGLDQTTQRRAPFLKLIEGDKILEFEFNQSLNILSVRIIKIVKTEARPTFEVAEAKESFMSL